MSTRHLATWILSVGLGGLLMAAEPTATPRMPDGKPDLNGTWHNGGGIDFLQPVTRPDGSVCVTGCTPGAPRSSAEFASRLPQPAIGTARPKYRPEFQARVDDLKKRQQKEDGVLRCQPPGVPRIGPPDKIVQNRREVVFLYEDVSGPFFRIVPLVPGVKRADDSESYLGDAEGHWEGDTLVVVSRNFNDAHLADGRRRIPHHRAGGHRAPDPPGQRSGVAGEGR